MSVTDELVASAERYRKTFDKGDLPMPPSRKVAVVTCMDARINPYALLGLSDGDAHVIRNAGGVVTEDVLRSLAISQHLFGTEEIVIVHHTDCGLLDFPDTDYHEQVENFGTMQPRWTPEPVRDSDEDVRQMITLVRADALIVNPDLVRGFVYDVSDGSLREVS